MYKLLRVTAENEDFRKLVKLLDAELAIRDGEDHAFYHQFNGIADIHHALVAYSDGIPAACGAIKPFDPDTMEIKRMYTTPDYRGKGMASRVLRELEIWARDLGCSRCILETGKAQPEAIAMYRKKEYLQIPNYGQYVGVDNSLCFEKKIN